MNIETEALDIEEKVVGRLGFEPRTNGLKVRLSSRLFSWKYRDFSLWQSRQKAQNLPCFRDRLRGERLSPSIGARPCS
jgi:hypothetical protein